MASLKILGSNETDISKFQSDNDADKRMKLYEMALKKSKNRVLVAANALRVEELILNSTQINFTKNIAAKLFGKDVDPQLQESGFGEKIQALRKLSQELNPENFLSPGYGVPLANEFDISPQKKIDEVNEEMTKSAEDMKSIALEFFPEQMDEIKKSGENRLKLLNIISAD